MPKKIDWPGMAKYQGFHSELDMMQCLYSDWTGGEIGNLLGVAKSTVSNKLKALGIRCRKGGWRDVPANRRVLSPMRRVRMFELLDQGLTLKVVGYRLGVDYNAIWRSIKKYRPRKNNHAIRQHRKSGMAARRTA